MIPKLNKIALPFIVFSALAGMALVFYSTTLGPGVGGDATIYLTSASNLIHGKGLGWIDADGSFRLLPYTPPFYPLVLSFIGLLGHMPGGARFINILFFGATTLLAGWAFTRYTGRAWLGMILGLLLGLSPVLIGIQVWAMSESLFLLVGLAGMIAMLRYLDGGPRAALIWSAVLCGLAFLTRYMGLSFLITGGVALLFFRRGKDTRIGLSLGRKDWLDAVLFGVISVLPIVTWLVIDFLATGTVGSRSGQPVEAYWRRFLEIGPALQKIYLFWFLPDSAIDRVPGLVQVAAWLVPLVVLAGLVWLLVRRISSQPENRAPNQQPTAVPGMVRMAALFGLFILAYLLVLAVVQVFTYPPITLASRMLSPVHLAFLVWVCCLVDLSLSVLSPRWRWIFAAFSLVILLLAGSYGLRSLLIARNYHNSGIGYNAPEWKNSPTIAKLRQLPASTPLISNEDTAIMYLIGRPAYPVQEIYQSRPVEPFTVYGVGDDPSQKVFRQQQGALVLFKANLPGDFAMYGDRIDERIKALTSGLFLYYDGEDGSIYFFQKPDLPSPDQ